MGGVRSLFTVGAVWKMEWVRKENEREFSCGKWSGGSVRLKRYLFGVIHAWMLRDARWRAVASSIHLITGNRSGCAKEGLYALHILLLFSICYAHLICLPVNSMCLFMLLNAWCWELSWFPGSILIKYISWMQICKFLIMHTICGTKTSVFHLSCGSCISCPLSTVLYKYKNIKCHSPCNIWMFSLHMLTHNCMLICHC